MRTKQQIESFVAGLPLRMTTCGESVFARVIYGEWQGKVYVKADLNREFGRAALAAAETEARKILAGKLWDVAQAIAEVGDE